MCADDPAGQFTDLLIQAADKAIPKTRFSKKLPKVLWFNDSCKKAIKERKKAQRKFFSNPTLSYVFISINSTVFPQTQTVFWGKHL